VDSSEAGIMSDSLTDMLAELQQRRPPVYDADRWAQWLEAVGQVIAAYPTIERRWACVVILANDLVEAMPGVSLPTAYGVLAQVVFHAECVEGKR
jgi:hypothetical protein